MSSENTAVPIPQAPDTDQVLHLLGDLEQRLGALKQWQHDSDKHTHSMREQAESIAHREAACQQRAQDLTGKQDELDKAWADLDRQKSETQGRHKDADARFTQLDQQRQEVEKKQAELDAAWTDLEKQRQQVAGEWEKLEATRKQIAADSQKLDKSWAHFREQETALNELDSQCQAERQEVDAQRAKLDEARKKVEAELTAVEKAQAAVATQRRTIDADSAAAAEMKARLENEVTAAEQLKAELTQSKKQYEKQRFDLKLRAEALASQQQQLERAREELAEQASTAGEIDPAAAGKIESIKAELDKSRQEIEAQKKSLALRASEMEARQGKLDQKIKQLEERESNLSELNGRQSQGHAEADERVKQLEARTRELERHGAELEKHNAELERRGTELESKRKELESKQAAYREAVQKSKDQLTKERDQLRQREQALEAELERVKTERDKYAQRKTQIVTVDDALRQRREKLHRYRKVLRQRSQALQEQEMRVESSSAQFTGLEKERQMLVEVKKFLEMSEAEMVSRWATQKAAGTLVGLIVAVALLAAISYGVSMKLVKPIYEASMTMHVDSVPGDAQTPNAWLEAQQQALLSESVLNETVNQLRHDEVRDVSNAAMLAQRFEKNLSVTGKSPRLTLTYRADNPQTAEPVLAALGRAYLGYRMSQDRAAGRDDSAEILQPASGADVPIENERLQVAGIAFGASIVGGLILFCIIRFVLNRSKRVFDASDTPVLNVLDKPETWSPLHRVEPKT